MIAKVTSIAHGFTDIAYISGESANKKHPEKIHHLVNNGMADDLDAEGIWTMMQLSINSRKSHKPMTKTVLRIELSPDPANVRGFTQADWLRLWQKFVRAFDSQELRAADGRIVSPPTNIAGSRYTVWLHHDSRSGIPHLHAAVCRVDMEGNTNNDHQVHLRAQRAAEAIAREYGWKQSTVVSRENIAEINNACYNVLRAMPRWSIDDYFSRLRAAGYKVESRPASDGRITGYTIIRGNSRYKASVLGKGRNLLASKLPSTWQRMHPTQQTKPTSTSVMQTASDTKPSVRETVKPSYTEYRSGYIRNEIERGNHTGSFFLPPSVNDYFDDEFDYRAFDNHEEMRSLAVALFVGWLEYYAREAGSGGGGSTSDLRWGRERDEDELAFARRCAARARQTIKPQPRKGLKR